MLASGVGLSVAGFCVPPVGEISSSVLWFFSQCLIYAGAALGIDVMIDNKLKKQGKEYMLPAFELLLQQMPSKLELMRI